MLNFLREENTLTGRLLPPLPTSEEQQLHADVDLFQFRQLIFRCMLPVKFDSTDLGQRISDNTFREQVQDVTFSASTDTEQILKRFENRWTALVKEDKTPFKHISKKDENKPLTWYNVRGCLGETVLHWLMHTKSRAAMAKDTGALTPRHTHRAGHDVGSYVNVLLKGLIGTKQGRLLMTEAYSNQPYIGQTILHMACAEGDEDMTTAILAEGEKQLDKETFRRFLDCRMTGDFLQTVVKRPDNILELECFITPSHLDHGEEHKPGLTAIEVAIVAMTEQHAEIDPAASTQDKNQAALEEEVDVIKRLLHKLEAAGRSCKVQDHPAGAAVVFKRKDDDGETKTLYSLLHLVARCRWQGPGPYQMTEQKTVAILKMLVARENGFDELHRREKNARGFTALQCAAMVGNQAFYTALLDDVKVTLTRWGNTHEYGFPLAEIDSGADQDSLCALELMTLYKRGNLLSLGLSRALILEKWSMFGRTWMVVMLSVQLVCAVLTAIVCLDARVGYSPLRWWSRAAVLSISAAYTIIKILLYVLCASDERFFQHMPFFGTNYRIGKFEILSLRSSLEMITMAIIVLTVPWYHREWLSVESYNLTWHFVASIWWFFFCWHLIRFFELFEKTGPIASALPEVLRNDMIPFLGLYVVIFMGSAIALRIATTTSTVDHGAADAVVGTFKDTVATLEEAIHGPDVQWRTIVYHHSPIAAFVFVAFLWITLMMMTILIALFSDRYAALQAHTTERFLFRRAMFVITMEKIMPTFYHDWMQFEIGSSRGGLWSKSRLDHAIVDSHHVVDLEAPESHRYSESVAKDTAPSESSPLIQKHVHKLNTRWYLWRGGKTTLHRWKQNIAARDDSPAL